MTNFVKGLYLLLIPAIVIWYWLSKYIGIDLAGIVFVLCYSIFAIIFEKIWILRYNKR